MVSFSLNDIDIVNEVRESALMVLEENNKLIQKLEKKDKEFEDSHNYYHEKVRSLEASEATLKIHSNHIQQQLEHTKSQLKILGDEYKNLQNELDASIPMAEHEASVNKCKNLFLALKNEYSQSKIQMEITISDLSNIIEDSGIKLEEADKKNDHLKEEIQKLRNENLSLKKKLEKVEHDNKNLEANTTGITLSLNKLNLKTDGLMRDKSVLKELLQDKERTNAQLLSEVKEQYCKIGQLENKLKVTEEKIVECERKYQLQDEEYARKFKSIQKDFSLINEQISFKDIQIQELQDSARKFHTSVKEALGLNQIENFQKMTENEE